MADDNFSSDPNVGRMDRTPPLRPNGNGEVGGDPASERTAFGRGEFGDAGRSSRDAREHSPAALLRRLLGEAALLFRKEIALAASEVSQSIDSAKQGAIGMVAGGAVLYAGLLFLLGAAAFALALVIPLWAAWLIVGAATAILGTILLLMSKSRVSASSFAPNRTVDALKKDSVAIRRQM